MLLAAEAVIALASVALVAVAVVLSWLLGDLMLQLQRAFLAVIATYFVQLAKTFLSWLTLLHSAAMTADVVVDVAAIGPADIRQHLAPANKNWVLIHRFPFQILYAQEEIL